MKAKEGVKEDSVSEHWEFELKNKSKATSSNQMMEEEEGKKHMSHGVHSACCCRESCPGFSRFGSKGRSVGERVLVFDRWFEE